MDQIRLFRWLKAVMIGTGICGALIYFAAFPFLGRDITAAYPEFRSWYWPWLSFLWLTAIPCCAALVIGWKIVAEIGRDHFFCIENIQRFRILSFLAGTDSVLVLIGNIVFLLLNMNHPGVLLFALLIVFTGFALAVVFAALSHLVLNEVKPSLKGKPFRL